MVWYFEARLYSLTALVNSSYSGNSGSDMPHAGLSQGSEGPKSVSSPAPQEKEEDDSASEPEQDGHG